MIILVLFVCKIAESNDSVPELPSNPSEKSQIGMVKISFQRYHRYLISYTANVMRISYYFVESIKTKFISEIGLERNSENSIMEITGFDRYVMGGKVTVMKDLIICTYPESRILKQSVN